MTAPRRIRRILTCVFVGVTALFVAFVIAGLPLYVFPSQSPPGRADAVLIVGPADAWRVTWAQQLLAAGTVGHIVISNPGPKSVPLCAASDPQVTCFQPNPSTTQGEARAIARIMASNGWTTLDVITLTTHVTRTAFIVGRCVPNGVQVVGRPTGLDFRGWVGQYIYQSAGWIKNLLVTTGC